MKNNNIIHDIKFHKPDVHKEIVVYEGHYNHFNYNKHVHEDYTISVIQKGKMSAFLRGFNYKFDKSSIITINPDEVHACGIIDNQDYKHRSLYIKPQTIKDILKENFSKNQLSFSNSHFNNDFLYQKLSFLTNEDNISLINKLSWECELIDIINHILKVNSKANDIIELPAHKVLIKNNRLF